MANDKYAVYIKNHISKKWEVMKLAYDPRTKKRGEAIYTSKNDALFAEQTAHALSGDTINTRVAIYQ